MTSRVQITAHNAQSDKGVLVKITGKEDQVVANGDTLDFYIYDDLTLSASEIVDIEDDNRDGAVTAKSFNPSNNPVVDQIKSKVEDLARYIEDNVPACRRRSIAMTHIETASMFAVKANFYPEG